MSRLHRLFNRIIGEHTYVSTALIDQALVSGTSFVTAILLARFLGAEEFGRYVLAWFAVYLAQNVHAVLIRAPFMTLSVDWKKHDKPAAEGAIFTQQVFLAVFTAVVTFTALKLSGLIVPSWRLDTLALPTACLAAAIQGPDLFRVYNFVRNYGWRSVTIDALRCFLQLALLLALFTYTSDIGSVASAIWVMVLANLVPLSLCLWWTAPAHFDSAVLTKTTKRHWRFSRWLLASTFAQWGRESLASVAVGHFLGLAEVGILRAAQQLVFAINVPLQALGNVIPVYASRAWSNDGIQGLKQFMTSFAFRFMLPMATLLLIIGLIGEALIAGVYGGSFAGYGYIVTLYAVVMAIYLVKDALVIAIRAMQKTDVEFYANILAAIVGALVVYPLVMAFGMVGALLSEGIFIVGIILVGWHLLRSSQMDTIANSKEANTSKPEVKLKL